MFKSHRHAFTLIELLVVVVVLGVLIGFLLLGLSKVRKSALAAKLARESGQQAVLENPGLTEKVATSRPAATRPHARVKTFEADVELTPRLSIGTAEPESVYEAKFSGTILAVQPADYVGESELELPLPPAIISLANLSVTAAGRPATRIPAKWKADMVRLPRRADPSGDHVHSGR